MEKPLPSALTPCQSRPLPEAPAGVGRRLRRAPGEPDALRQWGICTALKLHLSAAANKLRGAKQGARPKRRHLNGNVRGTAGKRDGPHRRPADVQADGCRLRLPAQATTMTPAGGKLLQRAGCRRMQLKSPATRLHRWGGRRSASASAMKKAGLWPCSHGAYTEATVYCEPYRQQSTLMQRPAGSAALRCETSVHGSLDVKSMATPQLAEEPCDQKAGPRQAAAGPAPSNNHL